MSLLRVFAAITVLMTGTSSMAAPLDTFRIGNWRAGAYSNDQTGAFSHCAASASYRSGIRLLFAVNSRLDWSMGFASNTWNLTAGQSYPMRYQVDGGPVRSGTARAIDARMAIVDLPDRREIFDEFRYGVVLKVEGSGQLLQFHLKDTARMLTQVLACANSWRTRTAGPSGSPSNPFSGGSPPASSQPPVSQPPGPAANGGIERRIEATAVATNLLNKAGVGGFEMLLPARIPQSMRNHDAVWSVNGLIGSLRILTGAALTPERIVGDLIGSDARACTGTFASGALPGQSGGRSVFTICEGERGWNVTYITSPRSEGGFYLVSITGPTGKSEEVKALSSRIRSASEAPPER